MVDFTERTARQVIETILNSLRTAVARQSLKEARLPGWLRMASVRIGWVNESLVAVFEDTTQRDSYEIRGSVRADTVILLDTEDFAPRGASLRAREVEGLIVLIGEYAEQARSVLRLVGERPALFDCGYAGYHGPRALINIFLQLRPEGSVEAGSIATRFVPFAFYVHKRDAVDPARTWRLSKQHLTSALKTIHDSNIGSFYEQLHGRVATFGLSKKTGVIVLGKDSPPELNEMKQVRDHLKSGGYDTLLVKELAEIPMMSNEEKVRLWTLASRFSVMVDRVPAGHLAEYVMLREQRTILAILRPRSSRSTYMVGDDDLVDVNFIRVFEFEESPLEALPEVAEWAEEIASERAKAYEEAYPWRKGGPS